jgi:glycine/D-amino acid oxidase-like deaminating enzyme
MDSERIIMADKRDIIVVGGGIIGASIAWHLVAAGAKVRLIAGKTGGVATPTSFAWINASWGNPEPYFRLRTRSMAEWTRLAKDVPGVQLAWCGGLCWDLPREELLTFAREHGKWGYDVREVDADEASRIEPAVKNLPDLALHVREEGAAEPVAATIALIESTRARGLEVLEGVAVTGLETKAGKLTGVRTADGIMTADAVVIASGADTPKLASTIGIAVPIEAPPGLIVHSRPVPKLLNGLVIATELHVRQTHDGRIIAGSDFGGTDPGNDAEGAARDLFAKLKAFLKDGESLEMDFHTVGYRPTPKDGFPILGGADGVEGLYLAVTHSGITLAPAIGRFAAEEILTGASEPLLAPYRLSRFAAA